MSAQSVPEQYQQAHAWAYLIEKRIIGKNSEPETKARFMAEYSADPKAFEQAHRTSERRAYARNAGHKPRPKPEPMPELPPAHKAHLDQAQTLDWGELLTRPLHQTFGARIPPRPYCSDDPRDGQIIRGRMEALKYRHVSPNSPALSGFIVFDQDESTAMLDAVDRENVPNVIMGNPANGHAHIAYALRFPVGGDEPCKFGSSLAYLAAVERGLRRKYAGDPSYHGGLLKNPLHPDWRTCWTATLPYTLAQLHAELTPDLMRKPRDVATAIAHGRNEELFAIVRAWAYQNVRTERRNGISFDGWKDKCELVAIQNNVFHTPLMPSEVRAIAKSVSKWTWAKFNDASFSTIQRARRMIAVEKQVVNISKSKPWISEGIGRTTWYERKSGLLIQSKNLIIG
jgi:Replicase family/Primase C terminal 1 (PriCT-1)